MNNKQRGVRTKEKRVFNVLEGRYVSRLEVKTSAMNKDFDSPIKVNPLNHFNI